MNILRRPLKPAQYVMLCLAAAVVLLLAFAFLFTGGQPVFFLKWFFGLQADD
jgi:hypothetical protein